MRTQKLRLHFFIIYLYALFQSCSDNSESKSDKETDLIIQKDWRIKGILPGVWVPDEYIQRIESTRSPYKSSDVLKGVATMIIECDSSTTDSVIIGASWNNHEGYNFTVYFDSTNYLLTSIPDYDVKSNTYRLGYDITNRDTFLILSHFNMDNSMLDQKKFRRVALDQKSDGADWGLTYIINTRLFSGQYRMLDSTKSGQISFSTAGHLKNFKSYKGYRVLTDFLGGPPDFDNICFEKSDSKYDCFSFKFSGDTLTLFELIPTGEYDFEKVGDTKYTLVRARH
jgi:hypothetical protein